MLTIVMLTNAAEIWGGDDGVKCPIHFSSYIYLLKQRHRSCFVFPMLLVLHSHYRQYQGPNPRPNPGPNPLSTVAPVAAPLRYLTKETNLKLVNVRIAKQERLGLEYLDTQTARSTSEIEQRLLSSLYRCKHVAFALDFYKLHRACLLCWVDIVHPQSLALTV